MAEEQQTPEEENNIVDDAQEAIEESVADALEVTEELSEAPAAQAVDNAIETFMDAVDDTADASLDPTGAHHYSDEVVLPFIGSIGSMPGGIYTFIFIVLAVITLVEVLISLLPENAFIIALLVVLSLSKAYLVVMFYMHLNRDNKLFRLVVLLPLIIALLSTLFLLGVPSTGLGYS